MKKYNRYIALFYLIFFISIKLSGFHMFAHEDNELYEDCEVCEYVLSTNKIPLLQSDVSYIEIAIPETFFEKDFFCKDVSSFSRALNYALFSRPPPTA